ncbi:response regulator [Crenalkalicoccus roseus]|uniref:response regulator n=1 Tax=Crenalkalicoccus roseus TaxID=1485588 RepID=UPI00107FE7B9|nr:response regulator [Crenalkalicoccus roseus]
MAIAEEAGHPLRILVAEDEALAAMVVEDALTDLGHEVLLASDGAVALELADRAPFDVLVTDLAMPRLPGWELIPRLRARHPGLPVVVMTGYLPPGMDRCLCADEAGPLTVLMKPFDVSALARALASVAPCRAAA